MDDLDAGSDRNDECAIVMLVVDGVEASSTQTVADMSQSESCCCSTSKIERGSLGRILVKHFVRWFRSLFPSSRVRILPYV